MWAIDLPHWWDFVVRAVVVYVFLLVLLRLTGKRQVGQLAPFDLVLLLVLSNAVQNSMSGGDSSITGGMILATTLVMLNFVQQADSITRRHSPNLNVVCGVRPDHHRSSKICK